MHFPNLIALASIVLAVVPASIAAPAAKADATTVQTDIAAIGLAVAGYTSSINTFANSPTSVDAFKAMSTASQALASAIGQADIDVLATVEIFTPQESADIISSLQQLQTPITNALENLKSLYTQVAALSEDSVPQGPIYRTRADLSSLGHISDALRAALNDKVPSDFVGQVTDVVNVISRAFGDGYEYYTNGGSA
ncbi:hypothetical protein DXG01_011663 [Tephrocybe rancida]|nr:hypothetical protein DXG01_011663 [Tephrocybe rancida]